MKKLLTAIVAAGIVALSASPAWSADADDVISNNGGVESLRGKVEISSVNKSESLKRVPRQQSAMNRNYVQQPPLVPHSIRGYEVNLNANKCLSCHSFKNAGASGATKISVTHYLDRDGNTLADVSPNRYFCLQCHVTQSDGKPLIENTFTPTDSLR